MTAVAFDTETWLIRPAQLAPPMVCLTSAIPVTGGRLYHADPAMQPQGPIWSVGKPPVPDNTRSSAARGHFEWLLKQDPIYGLNVAYDMCVALAKWPDLFPEVFAAYDDDRVIDVGLSQRLIDIAVGTMKIHDSRKPNGYSLAGLVKRYFKEDRSAEKEDPDAWRLRYAELRNVPLDEWPAAASSYALKDAEDTLKIGLAQQKHLKYLKDAPAQARAAFALQLMMCWGVKTDPERIERLREVSEGLYHTLTEELIAEGLVRKNGTRDTKAAKKRMFEVTGGRIKLTKTGYQKLMDTVKEKGAIKVVDAFTHEELLKYTSVDEDACKQSGDDVLNKYSRRTQLHTIVNTHIPDLLAGVETPIQPRYSTLVESGRTACSKSRAEDGSKKSPTNGFQFQNPKRALDYFPKGVGIRECFIARDGHYFADDDFSGLELHTGAQVCLATVGFSRLAEMLNAGMDPHLSFGAQMMGISYEEAKARKHEKEVKYYRQLAKVANFGFPGGLGVAGMIGFARGYGVKLTESQVKKLRDDWFKTFPEWVEYFKWVRGFISIDPKKLSRIEQLYVGRVRGGITFTSGCNTMFQGLGADGAKHALYEVSKRCYVQQAGSVLYGARPVGFVHDEILAEVQIAIAHEQAYEMAKVMVDACNKFLPDVPVRCEPALCKRWTKDAEAVFNYDGRLQPFDLAREEQWEVYWDQEHREPVKWAA